MRQGEQGGRAGEHNIHILAVEGIAGARSHLERLGCDPAGVAIMSRKMVHLSVAVESVQARAANIIKQVMLSKGAECATPRGLLTAEQTERVGIVMMGTLKQFREALKNLVVQPFGLKALAAELESFLEWNFPLENRERIIRAGGHTLTLGGRTLVMGIVNVTPDSFSDGGRFQDLDSARERALQIAEAGADVIDIGGESTRPGAEPVSLAEEERSTIPLIEALAHEIDIPISIDTYKAVIASKALEAGASIVNDVSALRLDPEMAPLVAERGVPVILMHMQGMPRDMQEDPRYDDVVADISRFLLERAQHAQESGVERSMVMIDPGIGFGKTVEHNLEILRRVTEFRSLGYPLVLGTSRKRFIGSVLDREVDDRLLGTAATVAFSIARGVDMVRVHDVEEMAEVVRMADACAGKLP